MTNSKIFIISVDRNDIPIAGYDNNHIGAIMEIHANCFRGQRRELILT